jgi:hypothetical protein
MLTHFFILAVIFQHFQLSTLISTLEGFSIACVEKHHCPHTKSLITCKVILSTLSNRLDAFRLNKVVYREKFAVKW